MIFNNASMGMLLRLDPVKSWWSVSALIIATHLLPSPAITDISDDWLGFTFDDLDRFAPKRLVFHYSVTLNDE